MKKPNAIGYPDLPKPLSATAYAIANKWALPYLKTVGYKPSKFLRCLQADVHCLELYRASAWAENNACLSSRRSDEDGYPVDVEMHEKAVAIVVTRGIPKTLDLLSLEHWEVVVGSQRHKAFRLIEDSEADLPPSFAPSSILIEFHIRLCDENADMEGQQGAGRFRKALSEAKRELGLPQPLTDEELVKDFNMSSFEEDNEEEDEEYYEEDADSD